MADNKRERGRPARPGGADKPYTVRLSDDIINKLDAIAAAERERTGYSVERSDIIRRAIIDLIGRFQERGQ